MKNIFVLMAMAFLFLNCSSDSKGGSGGGLAGGKNGNKTNVKGDSQSVLAAGLVDLNGTWVGQGAIEVNGQTTQCEQVTFQFSQTSTKLSVDKAEYKCDGNNVHSWDQAVVEIKNKQIIAENTVLGTIDNTQLTVDSPDYKLTITRTPGTKQLTVSEFLVEENTAFKALSKLTLK